MYNEDNKLITTEGGVVNITALTLTLTSPFTIGRVKYTKTRSFYLAGLPPDLANRLNTNRRFEIGPTWIRKLDQVHGEKTVNPKPVEDSSSVLYPA